MVWLRSHEAKLIKKKYDELKQQQSTTGEGSSSSISRGRGGRGRSYEHGGSSSAQQTYNVGSGRSSDDSDDDVYSDEDGGVVFLGSISASDYDRGKFPEFVATTTGESKTGGSGGGWENVSERNADSDTVQDGYNCSEDSSSSEEEEEAETSSSESEKDDSDDCDYCEDLVSESESEAEEEEEEEEEEEGEKEKKKEEVEEEDDDDDDDVEIIDVETFVSRASNGRTEEKIYEERAEKLSSNGEVGVEKNVDNEEEDDDDVQIIDVETVVSRASNGGTEEKIYEERAEKLSSNGEVGVENDVDVDDDVQIIDVEALVSRASNGRTEVTIGEERGEKLSSNGEVGVERDVDIDVGNDDVDIIDVEAAVSRASSVGTEVKICEERAEELGSNGEVGMEKDVGNDDVEIIDVEAAVSGASNGGTEVKICEERAEELGSNGEVSMEKDVGNDDDDDVQTIDVETAVSTAGDGRKETSEEKVDELSSRNEEVGMEEEKQEENNDEQQHSTPLENSEDENELERLWKEMANAPYENQGSSSTAKVTKSKQKKEGDARKERKGRRVEWKARTDKRDDDVGKEIRGRRVERSARTDKVDDVVGKETRGRMVEREAETEEADKIDSHGAGWWWPAEVTKNEGAAELGTTSDPPIPVVEVVEKENSDAAEESCCVDQAKQKNDSAEQRRNQQPIGEQPKEVDVVSILARSVLGDAELPVEEEPPAEEEEQQQQPCVLRKLIYDEQPSPPEKSEEEKELDLLWDEMALAQYEEEDCADASEVPQQVDVSPPDAEVHPATLCKLGRHQLILDEEIGVLCRYCPFLQLEIKYYVAPFAEKLYRTVNKGSSSKEGKEVPDGPAADCEPDAGLSRDSMLDEGTVWDIIPWIREGLHKHQQDGFEFLWRNIGGDIRLNKLNEAECSSRLSGCVVSHAPGTGKTRLTIRFLQTYMARYPNCRPMVIVPCSMLLTWEAEFKSLDVSVPRHNLNDTRLTGKENVLATNLLKDNRTAQAVRWVKLYSWQRETGILLLSYTLFEELVGRGMRKKRKNEDDSSPSKAKDKPVDEKMRQVLLEVPGLMVLDEGHTARNESSLLWRALSKVKTGKRVILSGTPFQNNFEEFFNTLWLSRPNFVDSLSSSVKWVNDNEKKRGREVQEARKKWQSMTKHLHKTTNDGVKDKQWQDLRALISPFVHVYNGGILQEKLPGLRPWVVILHPADLQKRLLASVQMISQRLECENQRPTERKDPSQYFQREHALSVASVHPYLLGNCNGAFQSAVTDPEELTRTKLDPDAGVKTKFLMELIKISGMINEKVLVFSQYLDPLRMIAEQLVARFQWTSDKDFLYMHGGLDVNHRQSVMKRFNDFTTDAKVLLASTKACSEGISLIGASRVVLLDVVWNPSVTRQAISRAYRLGQNKVVHVYNLITSGAIEEEKYSRQLRKDKLSDLVLYSEEGAGSCRRESSSSSTQLSEDEKDRVLEKMLELVSLKDMFKKVSYQPKEDLTYN